jgi:hypothetical protein
MKNFKGFMKSKSFLATVATGVTLAGTQAHAALDDTAVQTAITAAETSGLSIGQMVIAAVASFVVVGVVLGMIRKI